MMNGIKSAVKGSSYPLCPQFPWLVVSCNHLVSFNPLYSFILRKKLLKLTWDQLVSFHERTSRPEPNGVIDSSIPDREIVSLSLLDEN